MTEFNLGGQWTMINGVGNMVEGTIPGSVYSFLLNAGLMEDPYYRDNELTALKLMEEDYTFLRTFIPGSGILGCRHQVLRFEGIDTLADIWLNGRYLGKTDNMHITWEFDVLGILKEGENVLKVITHSPTKYIAEKDREHHLGGSTDAMRGFPHLRKAHCMFGWDWGPRLPDQGIWKDVTLCGFNEARLKDILIRQEHFLENGDPAMDDSRHGKEAREGRVNVNITVSVSIEGEGMPEIYLETPDGERRELQNGAAFCVPHPDLWWPNGLGEQPLYTLGVKLQDSSGTETMIKRIGLRTVTMRRKPDAFGETFACEVNGQTFFSMGADYIPEDCILSRLTPERTRKLLTCCRDAHFNVIRVWGGGFYPFDYFYDLCDELGLVVWQDCMFSCANYRITPDFVDSIQKEIRQNVRRIRHHASLGLWCGNNEMEQFALEREYDGTDVTAADYLIQNEYIIPGLIHEEDPDAFYWPSSPSSGGKFINPRDPSRGDVHYWDVWHAGVPFSAYRAYMFRYLSEFGFQSFPGLETIKSFTEEEDRNIFSYVMEMHQRNTGANGKIMQYLSATYRYPGSFETLLYASQLLQADAIRYGVEHFRRNRNDDRCMGAVYWQLNDNWPVASWSSIDYFGRLKALHYAAARFFAPVMISCEEDSVVSQGKFCVNEPGPVRSTARLCISNETWESVTDTAEWSLRNEEGAILESGAVEFTAKPFSALWLEEMDFSGYDYRRIHLSYRLRKHDSGGSVLFAPPKHCIFSDPGLSVTAGPDGKTVTVAAKAYARAVEIYSPEGYIRLEDNFFDMEAGERTLRILEGAGLPMKARSVYDIR